MKLARLAERRYVKRHLSCVRHITLDPGGPGVIRIHMVPPSKAWSRAVPWLLILNGMDILPVGLSWAILLGCFMDSLEPYEGRELEKETWDAVLDAAVRDTKKVYPAMTGELIRGELRKLLDCLEAVARGKEPAGKIRTVTLADYAPHMTAPHRMDLMVSAMERDGHWHCNQKCLHCYAAGQSGASAAELTTEQWKAVLKRCQAAKIPQITFTGGEPTLRPDLTELVEAAKWFVTRLNTNGRLLTPELCKKLHEASLDSVQITLYSADPAVHNELVGAEGFEDTVAGIRNALAAGLNSSVNTPLCARNRDYRATLALLHGLGIRYVTCSGLIPSGSALGEASAATALTEAELAEILREAAEFCRETGMELSFTSPGQVAAETLREAGILEIPSCGACLSNMAVRPDGVVVPCQSWLSGDGLGNILETPWEKIWNHPDCAAIRAVSAKTDFTCQLRQTEKEAAV